MAKTNPKTIFGEQVTKALIVKYYRLYENKKLESVSIFASPEQDDSIKPTKAKCTFCVKYKEEIAGFEQLFEEWLDPEDVCRNLEKMLLNFNFRGNAHVRVVLDKKVFDSNSTEKDIGAHFEGIVFENIERIVKDNKTKDPVLASSESDKLIPKSSEIEKTSTESHSDDQFGEIPVIAEVDDGPQLGKRM